MEDNGLWGCFRLRDLWLSFIWLIVSHLMLEPLCFDSCFPQFIFDTFNFLYFHKECNLNTNVWKHITLYFQPTSDPTSKILWKDSLILVSHSSLPLKYSLALTQWPCHHSVPIFFISLFHISFSDGMCKCAQAFKMKSCEIKTIKCHLFL